MLHKVMRSCIAELADRVPAVFDGLVLAALHAEAADEEQHQSFAATPAPKLPSNPWRSYAAP